MKSVEIDGVKIGEGFSPYIVAELSANHGGNLETALDTIKKAKECGANAIKIQTYTPDTMTINCNLPDFLINEGPWKGYQLYELYKEAYTPFDWHKDIFEFSAREGITCFSTPFDETAVDLLEDLNAPAYKIASFELTDLPLLRYVASTKKPMILSTGMATLPEIEEAIDTIRSGGCDQFIVLHCISSYPAPIEQSNLATLTDISKRFNCVVGLSDHTLGTDVAVAASALGACFIEKHFILDRNDGGPDSHFSIEPNELARLVLSTRNAWASIGQCGYDRKPAEEENLRFRRSIYVVEDIPKGGLLTQQNIRRIRPGFGLEPKYYDDMIGLRSSRHLKRGEPLRMEDVINDG